MERCPHLVPYFLLHSRPTPKSHDPSLCVHSRQTLLPNTRAPPKCLDRSMCVRHGQTLCHHQDHGQRNQHRASLHHPGDWFPESFLSTFKSVRCLLQPNFALAAPSPGLVLQRSLTTFKGVSLAFQPNLDLTNPTRFFLQEWSNTSTKGFVLVLRIIWGCFLIKDHSARVGSSADVEGWRRGGSAPAGRGPCGPTAHERRADRLHHLDGGVASNDLPRESAPVRPKIRMSLDGGLPSRKWVSRREKRPFLLDLLTSCVWPSIEASLATTLYRLVFGIDFVEVYNQL